jgi:hypothetical protein
MADPSPETNTVHVVGIGPVEIPAGLDPAELHRALNEYIQAQPTQAPSLGQQTTQPSAAGALENSYPFRSGAQEAWNTVSRGMRPMEAAFTINKNGLRSGIQTNPDTPGHGEVPMPVTPNDTTIVHTHPNMLQDRPSEGDIAAAKKWGHPIYIVSRSGLWMTDGNGNVSNVFSDPNWMNKN